jgi:hypothetical protein
MNIMTRDELHQLVDSLPEAALEPTEKALQHFLLETHHFHEGHEITITERVRMWRAKRWRRNRYRY